jgi:H+/Cl- antiporter ClcA
LLDYPNLLKQSQLKGLDDPISVTDALLYLTAWCVFTFTTYGVWVPAGLFLPGILIGCTVGILYLQFCVYVLGGNLDRLGG